MDGGSVMTDRNLNYYMRRAEEELAAADRAGDPAISNIHREMARLYRDMLDRPTARIVERPTTTEEMIDPRLLYG